MTSSDRVTRNPETTEAAREQQRARELWESLPEGTPVVVQFLGSEPRPAHRTAMGWESDDGMTGCTPWSVRLCEVWLRADSTAPASTDSVKALAAEVEAVAIPPGSDHFRYGYQCARDDAARLIRTLPVLAVSPAVTEREDDEALAAQLTERAADLERPLIESRTLVAAALVLRGVHENSTQNMGADFATSPAVTEGERAALVELRAELRTCRLERDSFRDIVERLAPAGVHAEPSAGPGLDQDGFCLICDRQWPDHAAYCTYVAPPAVTAAEDETWGREKPHTLTRYGTTNCPVEGVRADVDDGECSACGAPVVAAVPADPNEKD